LLEETLRQKVLRIIIAHKDRLVRFGFEWLERFLKTHGVELVLVPNEKRSPEQEFRAGLISIIDVFSCRKDGWRKYKKKSKGGSKMLKAFKTETDPTLNQIQTIHPSIGTCRWFLQSVYFLQKGNG
jgi:predicted site-specific integrase-resolvase